MKLNEKFIGQNVFIRSLRRKIEITEKNIPILLRHGINHVFVFEPLKNIDKPTTPKAVKKSRKSNKKDINE